MFCKDKATSRLSHPSFSTQTQLHEIIEVQRERSWRLFGVYLLHQMFHDAKTNHLQTSPVFSTITRLHHSVI